MCKSYLLGYWIFPLSLNVSPGGSVVKNLPANAGDMGDVSLIPGSGRSLGVGNGNPLHDSCLENSMDRGAWRATSPWGHKVRHNWVCTHTHHNSAPTYSLWATITRLLGAVGKSGKQREVQRKEKEERERMFKKKKNRSIENDWIGYKSLP